MSIRLVVVSGLSGSGKSSAIGALEDVGFFCVDNLPPPLINPLLALCTRLAGEYTGVAVGVDVRSEAFLLDLDEALATATGAGATTEVLFLVASDDVLQRRYQETRRRHPLASDQGTGHGIAMERRRLAPLRESADRVWDSSHTTAHQLRRAIRELYGANPPISIRLVSFGFKYGVPRDANLMVDVRFLPNPHDDPNLRPLDGRNEAVSAYATEGKAGHAFLQSYSELLGMLLPQYEADGRIALTLAVGCTGGRHRSVAVVEHLSTHLKGLNHRVHIDHRDVQKDQPG